MVKKIKKPQVHIGTSGFSYDHWKENFYPKGLKNNEWLHYYSQVFPTVELNTTFYHLPSVSTVKNWYAQVGDNFLFSLKASRYITHMKRLHDCKESVDLFYQRMKLKSKTGPILFQLPPSFKMDKDRLLDFIKNLKKSYLHVFEFRHDSWYNDEIYEILNKHKIALCITDWRGKLSPEELTADFTYIRLHGPQRTYKGFYGTQQLKKWKRKIENWSSKASVFCYFDNDEKGYAIQDAKTLQEMF